MSWYVNTHSSALSPSYRGSGVTGTAGFELSANNDENEDMLSKLPDVAVIDIPWHDGLDVNASDAHGMPNMIASCRLKVVLTYSSSGESCHVMDIWGMKSNRRRF